MWVGDLLTKDYLFPLNQGYPHIRKVFLYQGLLWDACTFHRNSVTLIMRTLYEKIECNSNAWIDEVIENEWTTSVLRHHNALLSFAGTMRFLVKFARGGIHNLDCFPSNRAGVFFHYFLSTYLLLHTFYLFFVVGWFSGEYSDAFVNI